MVESPNNDAGCKMPEETKGTVSFHLYKILENANESLMSKGDQWFSGDGIGCGEEWQAEIIIKGHQQTFLDMI